MDIASVSIVARLDFSQLDRDYRDLESRARVVNKRISDQFRRGSGITGAISSTFRQVEGTAKHHSGTAGRISANAFSDAYAKSLRQQHGRLNDVSRGIFQGIGQGITGALIGAAAAGGAAIGDLGSKILKAGTDAESAKVRFETFLGSTQAADKALRDLTTFAAQTPFELPEVREAASQLLAFGVTADELKGTLTRVGDVAAGIKIPFNELADIYGKIKVQNRLYMEDVNQLQGRGIPVIQELAKNYGKSTEEIKEMISAGKIGFKDLDAAFVSLTGAGGKFEGMMAKLSQTTGGRLSTMADKVTAAFTAIFETLSPVINESIDLMSAFLGGMNIDLKAGQGLAQGLANWFKENQDEAKALGGAVSGVVNAALKTTETLTQNIKGWLDRYPGALSLIKDAVWLISKGYQVWQIAVTYTVSELGKLLNALGLILEKSNEVWESFKKWVGLSWQNIGGFNGLGNSNDNNLGGMSSSSAIFPVSGANGRTAVVGGGGLLGAPRHYGRHDGQDYGFSKGTQVVAPITGKIKSVFTDKGEAKVVLEGKVGNDHLLIDLVHLESWNVKAGQAVRQGQQIGTVGGDSGSWGSSGTHLHLGVRRNGRVEDPKTFFGGGQGGTASPISQFAPGALRGGLGNEFDINETQLGLGSDYLGEQNLAKIIEGNRTKVKFADAQQQKQREVFQAWVDQHRQQAAVTAQFEQAFKQREDDRLETARKIIEVNEQIRQSHLGLDEVQQEVFDKGHELQTQVIDTIGASLRENIGAVIDGTKSLGRAALDLLGSIAKSLANLALNSIFGSAQGGTGILGGIFKGLFGGATQILSPQSRLVGMLKGIPSYDIGTRRVPQDQIALLHKNEAVIPAEMNPYMGKGAMGNTVNITINNTGSDPDPRKTAELVRRSVEAELIRQKRPGGFIY